MAPSTHPSSSGTSADDQAVWCGSGNEAPGEEMGAPKEEKGQELLELALPPGAKAEEEKFGVCAWIDREQLVFAFRNERTWSWLYNE